MPLRVSIGAALRAAARAFAAALPARGGRRAEEERDALAARIEDSLRFSNDAVLITRADQKLMLANDRAVDLLGYPREELLRLHLADVHDPVAIRDLEHRFSAQRTSGQDLFETRLRRKDGTTLPVEVSVRLFEIEGAVYYQGTIRNITERKQREEELAYQARLLDTLHDAVITLDGQLRVRSWNQAAERIYGWTAAEALGRRIGEVNGTEYADGEAGRTRKFEEIARVGVLHSDLVQHRKDGARLEVETETSVLRDADGSVAGYLLVNRDVTERRRAEEALRATEAIYGTLFKLAPSGVVLLDEGGRILEFNDQAHEERGYTREEFARLTLADLNVCSPEEIRARLSELRAPGQQEFEVRQRTKSGEIREVVVRGRRVEIGGATRFLALWQDVTERNRAEQAQRRKDALLRAISDSVPDPMVVKDREGRWLFANPGALAAIGKRSEEVLGKTDREIRGDDAGGDGPMEIERRVMDSGGSGAVEETRGTPSGRRVYLSTKAPYRDLDGTVLGVVSSSRDITERKKSEEALARQLAFLETLLETIPSAIFYKGVDGRYLGCNSSFAALWGLSRREVAGKSIAEVAEASLAERVRAADQELLRRPGVQQLETSLPTAGGLARAFVIRRTTFSDLEGQVAGIVGAMMDVTEQRALQQKLMQADRMASIGTLAAGVGHEINNPLAYVLGALEFVGAELAKVAPVAPETHIAEARVAIAEALQGAERIKHVVRDLKTFSRADESHPSPVDLRHVLDSSMNIAANEIRHRARVVKEYGPVPPVRGSEARLGQVFLNLLINAAQAIPEGRPEENEVRVVTGTDGAGRAYVEVRDTGEGIPPAIQERIFEPFFTTKPVGVGTGLGLSICRNIVQALRGEIRVERNGGRGTVFRVALPAADVLSARAEDPTCFLARPARRGRVLVVDDEPALCQAVARALSPEHEVVSCADGREALERITRGDRFDVILCDLMMPQMTGMDLHAALARSAPDQVERMVLLSGGPCSPAALSFLEAVANPRLAKPFRTEALRSLVRSAVGGGLPRGSSAEPEA